MRFSWNGLTLAPLLMPLVFSTVAGPTFGGQPIIGILLLLVPACIISYGATIFLFLPCLYLLSSWRPMTGLKVCLLGAVLGIAAYLPLALMAWKASGPDSGPPDESFFTFFVRWSADPLTALFPLAGLVTAGLYWWLGTLHQHRSIPAQR